MPRVLAYHRPATIDEALSLLREDASARVLGGGADLVGRLNLGELSDVTVVDLQALGLAGLTAEGDGVRLGAMTTLQQLADADALPPLLRRLARAEEPSTLRTRATLGGVVAGRRAESALLAGLLVADAGLTIVDAAGAWPLDLSAVLVSGIGREAIATSLRLDATGAWASAATGRTPADTPIVAAVGRRRPDGSIALALSGVAPAPVLVSAADPTAGLEPPGDFRGSSGYRRHLAGVLAGRVLADLGDAA